jgi:hypothetical protein
MTNQVQITVEHDVLGEPCPRCGSTAVRAVVYATSVEVVNESTDAPPRPTPSTPTNRSSTAASAASSGAS